MVPGYKGSKKSRVMLKAYQEMATIPQTPGERGRTELVPSAARGGSEFRGRGGPEGRTGGIEFSKCIPCLSFFPLPRLMSLLFPGVNFLIQHPRPSCSPAFLSRPPHSAPQSTIAPFIPTCLLHTYSWRVDHKVSSLEICPIQILPILQSPGSLPRLALAPLSFVLPNPMAQSLCHALATQCSEGLKPARPLDYRTSLSTLWVAPPGNHLTFLSLFPDLENRTTPTLL